MKHFERIDTITSPIEDIDLLISDLEINTLYLHQPLIETLEPLAMLDYLQVVKIVDAPITDLSPLTAHTQLIGLAIHHTQVRSVAPLAELQQLEILDLRHNQIDSLDGLENLPLLRLLLLDGNPLSSAQLDALAQQLPHCKITYSPPTPAMHE